MDSNRYIVAVRAQHAFLDSMSQLVPESVTSLLDLLPLLPPSTDATEAEKTAFSSAVKQWAHRWRVNVSWMYGVVWSTLLKHQLQVERRVEPDLVLVPPPIEDAEFAAALGLDSAVTAGVSGRSVGRPVAIPLAAAWDPFAEKPGAAKQRILAEISEELDKQMAQIERLARDAGNQDVPYVKKEHFDWLVRFQVLGESLAEIGRREDVSRTAETVEDGVKNVANLIHLPLRPGTPGRPRKNRGESS